MMDTARPESATAPARCDANATIVLPERSVKNDAPPGPERPDAEEIIGPFDDDVHGPVGDTQRATPVEYPAVFHRPAEYSSWYSPVARSKRIDGFSRKCTSHGCWRRSTATGAPTRFAFASRRITWIGDSVSPNAAYSHLVPSGAVNVSGSRAPPTPRSPQWNGFASGVNGPAGEVANARPMHCALCGCGGFTRSAEKNMTHRDPKRATVGAHSWRCFAAHAGFDGIASRVNAFFSDSDRGDEMSEVIVTGARRCESEPYM